MDSPTPFNYYQSHCRARLPRVADDQTALAASGLGYDTCEPTRAGDTVRKTRAALRAGRAPSPSLAATAHHSKPRRGSLKIAKN